MEKKKKIIKITHGSIKPKCSNLLGCLNEYKKDKYPPNLIFFVIKAIKK